MEIKPMENVYTDDYIGLIKLKTRVDVLMEMFSKDTYLTISDICSVLGYKLTEKKEPSKITVAGLCKIYESEKEVVIYAVNDNDRDLFVGSTEKTLKSEWASCIVEKLAISETSLCIGI